MQKHFIISNEEKQKILITLKKGLSLQKKIVFAFIYGSFVDDIDTLPFHDIDLGIYLKGCGEKESIYYSLDLSEKLSASINKPVDIRVLNFATVPFLYHVVRGCLLVDKDEDIRCAFMEWVIRHYLDMKPLLQRSAKEAFGS